MDFLTLAKQAARAAGEVLQDWSTRFTAKEKSPANLVTEADFASQKTIHELISSHFPDHGFLGEEGLSEINPDSPFRWIIDPLDGTSNYVHGFPYYAVSIALEWERELYAGVIYDPTRDEMFFAQKDRGAFLNDDPIQTSEIDVMNEVMAMASLPIRAPRNNPAYQRFYDVMPSVQTVQRTGSAALNLASTACGRIEAFWSTSLKPWDMAAGVVLVREAGGKVTQLDGSPFDIEVPDLLASNGQSIHESLSDILITAR